MKLLRDVFNDLDAFGRFWLVLGLCALTAAAMMSFCFGWKISGMHAVFLAVLTVVAAFGPMASEMLWGKGRRGPSLATALICIPLLGIEFFSHAGYTSGLRGTNIETASVQNARYDGAQEAVKEDETNLAMWREQLSTLLAQNAWAATVKADGLRARLDAAQKAIDLEAARGGCKTKCLARMQEKADIEKQIATVEQASDLSKRIEATQRVLDRKREKAMATAHVSSAVVHQNESLAKWVALVANGDVKASDLQKAASQESANLAMAVAGTGLPAFALFLAGLFRISRRQDDDQSPPASDLGNRNTEGRAYPQSETAISVTLPTPPTREVVHIQDDRDVWVALNRAFQSLHGPTQAAA